MKKSLQSSAPIIGGLIVAIVLAALITMNIVTRIAPAIPFYFGQRIGQSADPLVSKVGSVTQETKPSIEPGDFIAGNSQAPVKIFEFSDFSCPYCATMASTLKDALAKHSDVALVWRDFPITSIHPQSLDADIAANCAGAQGKFWQYHDALFADQTDFSRGHLLAIANSLGLKPEAFTACFDGEIPLPSIEQHMNEGNALAIDGTPYLFVDDQRISGQISAEELEQVIRLHTQIDEAPKTTSAPKNP